jgi:hypothetical protein
MAGDWIKIEKSTAFKPEVWRAAEILNIPPDQVLGLCFRFWSWCDDHLRGGVLPGSVAILDGVLGHPGFASALVQIGWLRDDGGKLRIPNHDRHMANSAKSRASDAQRAKRYRERKRSPDTGSASTVTENVTQRHVTERDGVTDASRGEEKRREEKRRQEEKTPIASSLETTQPTSPTYLQFPVSGAPRIWVLTIAQIEEWQTVYPDIDVKAEARKALAWIKANRQKTARGMPKFLVSWLGKATNDLRGNGNAKTNGTGANRRYARDFICENPLESSETDAEIFAAAERAAIERHNQESANGIPGS